MPFAKYWNKFYLNTPYPENINKNEGNFWYVKQLAAGNIVSNLEGKENKKFLPNYRGETIYVSNRPDENWDAEEGGKKKLQTENYSDKLLNSVLEAAGQSAHVGCVTIKRETIDEALWKGDPGERIPSYAQVAVLKKLVGKDKWQNWEIRSTNQWEIEGKHNLWTHLDGYFLEGGGRYGLVGGRRGYGGASGVDLCSRDVALGAVAVRLVLSRKHVG